MRHPGLSRRDLARAAGATLVVPAFLRQALAAPPDLPPRLAILMQSSGTNQPAFWPGASFRSPILAPLLDDPLLAARTTVLRGVRLDNGGPGNEHDRGFAGLWTGVKSVGDPADSWGGGPSIDQQLKALLAPRAPFPTINCGVQAADIGPKNGHRTSFSYSAARRQVPTETDPVRLYAALFRAPGGAGAAAADPAAVLRRLAQRRSVLDFVARDLALLGGRLPAGERRKLDEHATAVRELEARLGMAAAPSPGAICASPDGARRALDPTDEANVPVLMDLMIDFVAQALLCNLTRIVTFSFGYAGGQWLYRWLGIGVDAHSEVAHKDTGMDPVAAERMIAIGRWHAGYIARLARALASLGEGDGTALDGSLVVWGNENATGTHGLDGIPIVLVGRAGGRLAAGGRVVATGPVTQHHVATSVMRLMGADVAGFGDRPACGPVPGL